MPKPVAPKTKNEFKLPKDEKLEDNPETTRKQRFFFGKDGKPTVTKTEITSFAPKILPSNAMVVVKGSVTSNTYLKPKKKQKATRWTEYDEIKFFDALRTFGSCIEDIHTLVFSPAARDSYKNPGKDFSERSLVQLENKFKSKKDEARINEYLLLGETEISWFEKKYRFIHP